MKQTFVSVSEKASIVYNCPHDTSSRQFVPMESPGYLEVRAARGRTQFSHKQPECQDRDIVLPQNFHNFLLYYDTRK